jgi:uncharacterized protein (TIGR03067 family)
MNARLSLFALAACLAGGAAIAAGAQKDLDGLQGSWKLVGATSGGKKVPFDESRVIVIKGDRLEGLFFQKGKPAEVKFTLDPAKSPKWIDLEVGQPKLSDGSKKFEGIYLLQGDTLRLALGIEEDQKKRPKNFASASSFSFKRVKK